uniref:Uncharacterized protein n=1 Tax=Oryza barthii TaxID=65489 RepID=A0A0D3HCC8_9ORYZ
MRASAKRPGRWCVSPLATQKKEVVREGKRPRDKGEILWIDGSTTTDEEANLVSREDVGVLVMVGTGMG